MYILRWISMLTGEKGESATPEPNEDAARRAVTTMNGLQAGFFHWWFCKVEK